MSLPDLTWHWRFRRQFSRYSLLFFFTEFFFPSPSILYRLSIPNLKIRDLKHAKIQDFLSPNMMLKETLTGGFWILDQEVSCKYSKIRNKLKAETLLVPSRRRRVQRAWNTGKTTGSRVQMTLFAVEEPGLSYQASVCSLLNRVVTVPTSLSYCEAQLG